jgi:hypothetical protein
MKAILLVVLGLLVIILLPNIWRPTENCDSKLSYQKESLAQLHEQDIKAYARMCYTLGLLNITNGQMDNFSAEEQEIFKKYCEG